MVTLLGYKVDDSGREQYNKGIDQTKQKQQSFTASFLKANIIMSAVSRGLGAAIGFVRDTIIGTTAETERYRVAIGTMMHDQEKANKIIHDLDYSAVSDFYGTANVVGGLQNLISFGMQAEEASGTLTRLGDIALGNTETFSSLSNIMGKVFSKGKAEGIELKQFMLQGIDIIGVLSKSTGQSREQIEKLGVSYKDVSKALEIMTSEGGIYHKMLEKQGNTLNGIIKQFRSFKLATAEAIGLGINDNLKELLKYILAIGRAGQDNFVNTFVKGIKEVIHWIWQIIIMWKVLGFRLADMGDAIAPVKRFFSDLKDAAADVLTGIMVLSVEFGRLVVAAFGPVQAFASPIIKELGAIAKDVFTAIAGFIRPLVPKVSESAGFFGVLGRAVAGILGPALKLALAIRGVNAAIAIVKGTMLAAKAVIAAVKAAQIGYLAVMRLSMAGNKAAAAMMNLYAIRIKAVAIAQKAAAIAGKLWTGIQWLLNAAMTANPIGLIIAGIAALIAIIVLLVKNWEKVTAAVKNNSDKIMALLTIFTGPLGIIISMIKELVSSWGAVTQAFKDGGIIAGLERLGGVILSGVLAPVQGLLEMLAKIPFVGDIFKPAVEGLENFRNKLKGIEDINAKTNSGNFLGNFFSEMGEKISAGFAVASGKIKERVKGKTKELLADFKEKYPALYETAATAFGKIKEVMTSVFDQIKKYFSLVWQSLKTSLKALVNVFRTVFLSIWNVVKTIGLGIWNVIKTVFDSIKNVVMSILGVFKAIFTGIWNVIKTIFGTIFNTVFSIFDGLISIWKGGGNIFVKILNSIKLIFTKIWKGIFTIVKSVVTAIANVWKSIFNVFSTILTGIKNIFLSVWKAIENYVLAVVEGIKNVWISFAAFWDTLLAGIKAVAAVVWEGIKAVFFAAIDAVKSAWQSAISFVIELWEDIQEAAAFIWGGIKTVFFSVVDGIKAIWSDLVGFFSGLWEAIMQGPAAAIEYIKNAFFGLFNSIQEKLFGFINKIKEGWETVKGFFGGIADGVFNFFTGGNSDGTGGQTQPAYAGSASQAAMASTVGQTSNYAYTTMGGASTVNAQTSINVNVPPGTSQEQSEAIARQVNAQFDARLANQINSSRANIPTPEVRRH